MPKNFLFCLAFLIAFSSGIHSSRADDAVAAASPAPTVTPTVTPAPTPEETDSDEDSGESVLDRPDYDSSRPYYQQANPKWAFGLRVAIRKFPVQGALGNTFQVYGEYLLPYQSIGVFSIGPHFGSFPLYVDNSTIPTDVYENAVAGLALRYQLKITHNQWIVPTAAIEWEYYRIRQDATPGNTTQITGTDFGLSGGLMINLGIFDSVTARDGYQSLGLLRSYFTVELRSANINNALFSLSGNYWLFGLRMEFK